MSFVLTTLNHFRAIKQWAETNGASVQLDMLTFEIEIKAYNRYYRLMPQFIARTGGRLGHLPAMTPEATGIIGWLPYRPPLRWSLASDKLVFKRFIQGTPHSTPRWWNSPAEAETDYIVKNSVGSFGYGLYGPFAKGSGMPAAQHMSPSRDGQNFAEQFIEGTNIKAWFWGHQPFYVQSQGYPTITGDGHSTVEQLTMARLARADMDLDDSDEISCLRSALAYQGHSMKDVLPADVSAWLDYRYGRQFVHFTPQTQSDNALAHLPEAAREDTVALGELLAREVFKELPAPVLYSVDGVMDRDDRIHWLEMNSNPVLPSDGYPFIFSTLFNAGRRA